MAKLRVYELAQELKKTNKEVLEYLKGKNIEVKSHMSVLTDEDVDKVTSDNNSLCVSEIQTSSNNV